jgi:hypothetical protein
MFEIELVRHFQIAALVFSVTVHIFWVTVFSFALLKHITGVRVICAAFMAIAFVGLGVYPVFHFLLNSPLSLSISGVDRLYEGMCFTFVLCTFIFACSRVTYIFKFLVSNNS